MFCRCALLTSASSTHHSREGMDPAPIEYDARAHGCGAGCGPPESPDSECCPDARNARFRHTGGQPPNATVEPAQGRLALVQPFKRRFHVGRGDDLTTRQEVTRFSACRAACLVPVALRVCGVYSHLGHGRRGPVRPGVRPPPLFEDLRTPRTAEESVSADGHASSCHQIIRANI